MGLLDGRSAQSDEYASRGLKASDAGLKAQLPPRFEYHQATDVLGRRISYFLSKRVSGASQAPLALYIQGSGCHSVFRRSADGRVSGGHQNLLLDASSDSVRVLVVEKPGVAYLDPGGESGTAVGCRPAFLREHTLDRWSAAIMGAIGSARRLEGVARDRMLVIGHSEGGIVAAHVAARSRIVTHVALFGSSGPTQLFDLLENEREGDIAGRSSCDDKRDAIADRLQDIRRRPNSCSRFAWGHPYRRWSSFLATSVLDEAVQSRAKFRLVHGANDSVVPLAASKMLYAELLSRGRDVVLDLRSGANHGLATQSTDSPEAMREAFGSTLSWFFAVENGD